jgi:hypothetical protein
MSKHTPGPWVVNDIRDCGTFIQTKEEFENGRLTIGVVESATNRTYYPTRYEAKANARLIAAAPELLDALQHVLAASDAGDMDSLANAASEARAAIAKAEAE